MKRKILIVALLLMLLVTASFTGCGSDDTGEVSSAAGGETQGQSGFAENIYDMGGKTITIADSYWIGGDDATVEKNNCADALKEIEKDYNCKINVISPNMSTLERDITTNVAAERCMPTSSISRMSIPPFTEAGISPMFPRFHP